MRLITLCCLFCVAHISTNAQIPQTLMSIPYLKTNTYSSLHKDGFSFAGNQAALAGYKNLSIGFYGDRRFMLKELSSYQLNLVLPTSTGNFGLQGNYFGGSYFNQSQIGLAYGRSLGKIDVGAQFNYFQVNVTSYGNASALDFETGAILHISDQFQAGVHIYNPTRTGLGKSGEEKLPMTYAFGLGYDASEKFFIGTEIEKTEDQAINVNTGLHYSFEKQLFARIGISTANSIFYLGTGFLWNGLRIDIAASLHPNLGITPGMALVYNSPQKK